MNGYKAGDSQGQGYRPHHATPPRRRAPRLWWPGASMLFRCPSPLVHGCPECPPCLGQEEQDQGDDHNEEREGHRVGPPDIFLGCVLHAA